MQFDAYLNNTPVQNFSSYLTENTDHVHYKDQPV